MKTANNSFVIFALAGAVLLGGPVPRATAAVADAVQVNAGMLMNSYDGQFKDLLSAYVSASFEMMEAEERWKSFPPEVLRKPIDLDFTKARLSDVFQAIGQSTGVNIVVDPAVKDLPVDLHVTGVRVAEALKMVFGLYGLDSASMGKALFVAPEAKINTMATINKTLQLKNIKAKDVEGLLTKVVTSCAANDELNALVVTGSPAQVREAERIVRQLDMAKKQVLLITQVLEINRDAAKDLGVDWSDATTVNFQESRRPVKTNGTEVVMNAPTPLRIFRLARDPLKLSATINYIISENKGKILSNPKITAIAGKESSIFIGDKVPYEITTTTGGVANTEVRFAEAGVRLSLTPSIIEDDYVVVTVKPEVSNITAWKGPEGKYPQVRSREAQASVRVGDGETFVLGGLLSDEETNDVAKVPVLSKIPVMGGLFRYESKSTTNKEIVITITPRILN